MIVELNKKNSSVNNTSIIHSFAIFYAITFKWFSPCVQYYGFVYVPFYQVFRNALNSILFFNKRARIPLRTFVFQLKESLSLRTMKTKPNSINIYRYNCPSPSFKFIWHSLFCDIFSLRVIFCFSKSILCPNENIVHHENLGSHISKNKKKVYRYWFYPHGESRFNK